MRIGEFEFSRRELAGAMGDFGTLLPLAAGYIAVCGMDPARFLVMMGLGVILWRGQAGEVSGGWPGEGRG